MGAVVSIAGAFVVTLYRGPPIIIKMVSGSFSPLHQSLSPQSSWILGGIFLAAEAFLHSAWYNLQVRLALLLNWETNLKQMVIYSFSFFGNFAGINPEKVPISVNHNVLPFLLPYYSIHGIFSDCSYRLNCMEAQTWYGSSCYFILSKHAKSCST